MSKLVWDQSGEKFYETGVEQVALYKRPTGTEKAATNSKYAPGVAWNGVSAFNINPSGAEATPLYANNKKYLNLMSAEETAGTIEAYTYPDEWMECDGSKAVMPGVYVGQQSRVAFGLAVKTLIGNDTEFNKKGYKIHLIYEGLASVSEKSYSSVNDSPEVDPMSWEFTTTPVDIGIAGFEPSARIEINSTDFADETGKARLKTLEDALYGTDGSTGTGTDPYLPDPKKVFELLGWTAPTNA